MSRTALTVRTVAEKLFQPKTWLGNKYARASLAFLQISIIAMLAVVAHGGASADTIGSIDITGAVTNPEGTGVANVSVYATDPSTGTIVDNTVHSADGTNGTTLGDYDLPLSMAGTYDIHFIPPSGSNLNPVVNHNVVVLGSQVMNVQFTPVAHTFSGTLTNSAGAPIPNFSLLIAGTNTKLTTDADGHFSISLAAGKYGLSVGGSPPSGDAATALGNPSAMFLTGSKSNGPFDLTNGDLNQDIVLPTANITVTVRDADGNPVQGAVVRSTPTHGTISWLPDGSNPETSINEFFTSAMTNSNGLANVTSLKGAHYAQVQGQFGAQDNLCVTYPDSVVVCIPQPTVITGDTSFTFTKPVTHNFSGTLTNGNGTIIPNYSLLIAGTNTVLTTDADGHFSISLAAGKYGLSAGSNPLPTGTAAAAMGTPSLVSLVGSKSNGPFDLTNGDLNQDIVLPTANITVTVRDADGNPVQGAVVRSEANHGTMSWLPDGSNPETSISFYYTSATTDSSGTATVTSLKGADYRQKHGQLSASDNLCVTYPDTTVACISQPMVVTGNMSIVLSGAVTHTFSGNLTNGAGAPIPNYSLYIAGTDTQITTDADGHFSISLAAGKYGLSAGSNPLPTGTAAAAMGTPSEISLSGSTSNGPIDLTNGDLNQDIVLPTANIRVVVRDSSGQPVEGATVKSSPRHGTMSWLPDGSNAETNIYAYTTTATSDSSGVATVTSLKGATYNQSGGQSGSDDNLCVTYPDATVVCIPQPTVITGDTSIILQQVAPTPIAPTDLTVISPAQNPALTWTAVDGATSYNIYRDGTKIDSSTSASYTDNNASEGAHTYYVTAVNAGGESDHSTSVDVLVNRTAPTTTASLSPDPYGDGDYSDPVTVSLSATAARAGVTVTNTYYTLDGESQQTYSAPFTVSGTGDHTITYWSVDNSSLQESPNSKTFTIHRPPSIGVLSDATINEGGTLTQNGSFTSGAASWTATVDYGAGAGAQPLSLSGKDFSLNHTYKDNGSYTVTVKVTDNDGASDTATATVSVNNVAPAIGDITASVNPIQVNTSTTASADFTDPGVLDTHTATWDWGDGTTSGGTVNESGGSGSVSDSHIYTATGVYTITLTITDKDGDNATQVFRYLSVYNPTPTGLFSGARIFTSPSGAYAADPSLTGQAQFGVTSKYDHNNQPTGNVSMKFKAADFDFASTSVTVLVTSNGTATLRGSGTVNGAGNYTFLVTGLDSQQNGGEDEIRFQIKDSSGNVVYDSQPGAADTVSPSTPVTGQIIVH